ncbi:DUF6402 family protein [Motiliproteus sp. MSK22-1]|uniref:DUF6402 family protein n=1 Tax=Motiliproteus sp. MSK22-1 TaxID=1897630 RepID=UPI0009783DE8|nr:DUF6402 family protein [Motiliproteus sp. MSK22-1]OMH28059.1 hypothetical protein BGP75_22085 [Motiliproteus sp. MSK22-1]
MSDTDYFDITELFPVLEAKGWKESKNLMDFWAKGTAKTAITAPGKDKSTIGDNINSGMRKYTISWKWLNQFPNANKKYNALLKNLDSKAVIRELKKTYGFSTPYSYNSIKQSHAQIIPFNSWLVDSMQPDQYFKYIKDHQMQYQEVTPFEDNNYKLDDLVGALNNFNFYAFYKGHTINAIKYRENKALSKHERNTKPTKSDLLKTPSLFGEMPNFMHLNIKRHLENKQVKSVICVSHIGIYAGDIYEFNGPQYLGTWDTVNNKVFVSNWDALWGSSDTDDNKDLSITNETFRIYRDKKKMGGDFFAFSPIKLILKPLVIPIY